MLASRPRALLLDEPTAGQDAIARATLRALLTECAADGVAIIVATHDPRWAWPLCHRWAVLAEGRIAADTDPATVLTQRELCRRARSDLAVVPLMGGFDSLTPPLSRGGEGSEGVTIPAQSWSFTCCIAG